MTTVTVYAPGLTVEVFDEVTEPAPPPAPALAWSRLDTGGGSVGAYFRRPVVLGNGDIWAAWGANNQAGRGSFIFSRSTNTWARTSATAGVGYDIGARENYGAAFDADRSCVWIAAGAPVAYSQTGDLRFDVASGSYTQPYLPGLTGGDAAFLYWNGAHYGFGGWTPQTPRRRDIATGAVTNYGGASPPFSRQSQYGSEQEESPRLTYTRAGVRPDGTQWTLANDNELWTCAPGGNWTLRQTTGDKPTTIGIVATLVEAQNTIVAWCGRTGMVAAAPGVTMRQTWLLDFATLVWRKGPGLAAGDAVPTAGTMATTNLLSDGASALLTVDTNLGTEVWRLAWGSL